MIRHLDTQGVTRCWPQIKAAIRLFTPVFAVKRDLRAVKLKVETKIPVFKAIVALGAS
jgi:hypothetical protein